MMIDKANQPSGRLIIDVFKNGEVIDHFDEPNLIVLNSKLIQSQLLGGNSGYAISQIGFGTNGTAPVAGNTGLTGSYLKHIDYVSYPASNSVLFGFSLGSTENNGVSISEFGLFTVNGKLFARRVRSTPLAKTSDISLSASWIISF